MIKQNNFSKMKNKILPTCLQGKYRGSLGEFSNTSYGVLGAEKVKKTPFGAQMPFPHHFFENCWFCNSHPPPQIFWIHLCMLTALQLTIKSTSLEVVQYLELVMKSFNIIFHPLYELCLVFTDSPTDVRTHKQRIKA